MEPIIAFCGIHCDGCEARAITLANDDQGRIELAEKWSKQFNSDIKPEHINCLGCTVDSESHFPYWHMCEISVCVRERGHANCAHCEDYPCETLDKFHQFVPDARATLDEVRQGL